LKVIDEKDTALGSFQTGLVFDLFCTSILQQWMSFV